MNVNVVGAVLLVDRLLTDSLDSMTGSDWIGVVWVRNEMKTFDLECAEVE